MINYWDYLSSIFKHLELQRRAVDGKFIQSPKEPTDLVWETRRTGRLCGRQNTTDQLGQNESERGSSFLSTRLQILKGSQGAVHVEMNYMIIAAASAPSHIVKVLGQSFVSARSKDIYIDKNT